MEKNTVSIAYYFPITQTSESCPDWEVARPTSDQTTGASTFATQTYTMKKKKKKNSGCPFLSHTVHESTKSGTVSVAETVPPAPTLCTVIHAPRG